nr:unnamed protein product [Digitaria exilis]
MAGRSGRKKRGGRQQRNPAAELTDDILVEILSRVPYKSLCRFRCVSRLWSELISHSDHRRKLPQSLVGFFFATHDDTRSPEWAHHFVNVSSRDRSRPFIHPSLSFLLNHDCDHLQLLFSRNGLVLCCYSQPGAPDTYIVVNPATEKWVDVPASPSWFDKPPTIIRLGFDPAISSHFHVFAFDIESEDDYGDGIVLGVDIYSSKTRLWSYKPCGSEIWMNNDSISRGVFLDGMLYMVALENVVVAVDRGENMEGH